MKARWRRAAAVLLASSNVKAPYGKGVGTTRPPETVERAVASTGLRGDLRVFMVQRGASARFMPGAFVFPGGEVHATDFDPFWAQAYQQQLGEGAVNWAERVAALARVPAPRPPLFAEYARVDGKTPVEWSFRVCALRELFEECAILVLHHAETSQLQVGTAEELSGNLGDCPLTPQSVREQPQRFLDYFKGHSKYRLAFWALDEWSCWLTPQMLTSDSKSRFETLFYMLCLDRQVNFNICDQELQNAEWCDPRVFLRYGYHGSIRLPPPQIYELSRLSHFERLADLRAFSHNRARSHGVVRLCPQLATTDDGVRIALLPGDQLYDDSEGEMKLPFKLDEAAGILRRDGERLHRFEFAPPDKSRESTPWSGWTLSHAGFTDPAGHEKPISQP